VAVKVSEIRSQLDRLRTRLRRLELISEKPANGRQGPAQIDLATTALAGLLATGRPATSSVRLRSSFFTHREEPEGDLSDRTPPAALRPPVLAVASPNGIAQQLMLVALFVAQTQQARHRDGSVTFALPLEARVARQIDWLDVVVPHATHNPAAVYAANLRDNRLRQVKRALDTLAAQSLVALPNAGTARRKYEGFRLLDEGGARLTGPPLPYRVPTATDAGVDIPVGFFLNGWPYALTKTEIALWLMLRELQQASPGIPVSISGVQRLRRYGLGKDAYKSWWVLEEAGLLDAHVDPNRRRDGTVIDFDSDSPPERHRFQLTDAGLAKPAAPALKAALALAIEGEPVGTAKVRT
jgi:hypothetical protein